MKLAEKKYRLLEVKEEVLRMERNEQVVFIGS